MNVLHIPRLGSDWEWVVVEGVDLKTLNKAPGHFPGTALPGKVGNYAVAGHRATHGEPFADLDRLVEGDKVYVEAADGWFTYQVTWSRIIAPTHTEILAPVAGQARRAGRRPGRMTLVTCHPRWGSTERLVVGAQLVEERSSAAGPPRRTGRLTCTHSSGDCCPARPRSRWARRSLLLLLVLWLLMAVIFPAVEPHLPIDEVVVG